MRSSLFWDVSQHRLVDSDISENLSVPWSARPIGSPKMLVTTNLHCITSQKSKDLIYTASETWNHWTSTWNCVDFKQFILHKFYNNDGYYGMYGLQLIFVFTNGFSLNMISRIRTCRRHTKTKQKIKSYLIMHTRISVVTPVTCYRIQTGNCADLMTAQKLYPSLVSSTAPALFQFPSSGQLPTTNTDSCRRVSALTQNFQSRCSSLILWTVCLASTVTITYKVDAGFNNCLIS
jgi:hypothetical protein